MELVSLCNNDKNNEVMVVFGGRILDINGIYELNVCKIIKKWVKIKQKNKKTQS